MSVDWFVVFKAPAIPDNANPHVKAGYSYMYADSNRPTLSWSEYTLNLNTTGSIANTVSQIYASSTSTSVAWLMYNDQLPNKDYEDYAHSKGVIITDQDEGFWLVHSVPRYPVELENSSSYYYPAYETENGQSFLCVSYSISTIALIGKLLQINKPYVYESNFPPQFSLSLPTIAAVLKRNWITAPTSVYQRLVSVGGNTFVAFAKNSQWNKDLYEDAVEPFMSSGLWLQTWREGEKKDLMPSFCSPDHSYDSVNILSLIASDAQSGVNAFWRYTKDHSKWGVSMLATLQFSCIGDINRMYSQFVRGGGTVCFQNSRIYKSMVGLINSTDIC